VSLYWIRCRVSTVGNIGAALGVTNAKNHEIVTPNGGFVVRRGGTLTTLRLVDNAATLPTTAAVKVVLWNFTQGTGLAELTFSQDLRAQRWTGLSLALVAGDVLGVIVTQEDTAAEPSGVMLELGVTLS
jgi:hypothetical protein